MKHSVLSLRFASAAAPCQDSNSQPVDPDEALRRLQLGDATLLLLFAVYVVAGRLSAFKLRVPQLTTPGAHA